jgi:GGDEF domain-containing protein
VSIGLAVYPSDNPFKDGLLEAADMALAKAKEHGNDQLYTYAELAEEQGILSTE